VNALAATVTWQETARLAKQDDLLAVLTSLPAQTSAIFERSNSQGVNSQGSNSQGLGQKTLEATYTRPYQAHGSIGPSCAVAQLIDGAMTVWTHTQGVYPDRQGIAQMLRMPPASVSLIHVEGSGCYDPNGSYVAAAGRWRGSQRNPDIHVSQRPSGAPLHPGDAAADFRDAGARRLSQRVFDRELYGRTRRSCRCRPRRIPFEAS